MEEWRLSKSISIECNGGILRREDCCGIGFKGISQKLNLINGGNSNDHMRNGTSAADRMDGQIDHWLIACEEHPIHEIYLGKEQTHIQTLQDQIILYQNDDVKLTLTLHPHPKCYLLICHHLMHYLLQTFSISALILILADVTLLLREREEKIPVETSIDQWKHLLLPLALYAVFVKSFIVYGDDQYDIESSHADQSSPLRRTNPSSEFP
jgi:hypothetical protein